MLSPVSVCNWFWVQSAETSASENKENSGDTPMKILYTTILEDNISEHTLKECVRRLSFFLLF